MNSQPQSTSLNKEERDAAKALVLEALEACFEDPPTAGAAIVITSRKGTSFYKLNMDIQESAELLLGVSAILDATSTPHKIPELLQ